MSEITGISPRREQLVSEIRSHLRSKYIHSPNMLTSIEDQLQELSKLKRIAPKVRES